MQDFKFCMKSEQNHDDEGTMSWFTAILGFGFATNDPQKIKKAGNFERHDQLFMSLATEYLINALEVYLTENPASLQLVDSEESAENCVGIFEIFQD